MKNRIELILAAFCVFILLFSYCSTVNATIISDNDGTKESSISMSRRDAIGSSTNTGEANQINEKIVQRNHIKLSCEQKTILVNGTYKVKVSANNPITTPIKLNIPLGLTIDIKTLEKNNLNFNFNESSDHILTITPRDNQHEQKNIDLILSAKKLGKYTIADAETPTDITSIDLTVIDNPTPMVLAVAPASFDDGITNWVQKSKTEVGSLAAPGKKDQTLNYVFGGVNGGLDPTLPIAVPGATSDHVDNKSSNSYPTQMNVFIKDSGKVVNSFFRGNSTGYDAANTSLGFGLVFEKNELSKRQQQSILANSLNTRSYWVGTDENGNQVSKIMGTFTRDGKNLTAEIVLRPATSGRTSVQQELYLQNNNATPISYGVFLGQDTALDNEDKVPLYTMANNAGLYMVQGSYKMLMSMAVPDGPSSYAAQKWSQYSQSRVQWFRGFTPNNFSGTGLESQNYSEGRQILPANTDSAYTAKWPFTTLNPGETQHYRQDLGLTKAPDVSPEAYKSYTNLTRTDNTNRVGDKIRFTLRAHNVGYQAEWGKVRFIDKLDSRFKIDPQSIKLTDQNGNTSNVAATNYNDTTKELQVDVPGVLRDNQWATVTFEVQALSTIVDGDHVSNEVKVTGEDNKVNNQERSDTARTSIKFINPNVVPIAKKSYTNLTNPAGPNRVGDKIRFTLQAQNKGSKSSWGSVKVIDVIDSRFKVDPQSITLTDHEGNISNVTATSYNATTRKLEVSVPKPLTDNQTATVTFDALALPAANNTVVSNLVNVTGKDNKVNDEERNAQATTLVKFTNLNLPKITKKVKNITNNEKDFNSASIAAPQDKIAYQIRVQNTNEVAIGKGITLKDSLDSDLLVDKSVKVSYLDQNEKEISGETTSFKDNQIELNTDIPSKGSALIDITATVKDTKKTEIDNQASLIGLWETVNSDIAKLAIKPSTGKIIVRYRDRQNENHKLSEDELVTGEIGTTKKIQPKVIAANQGNWTLVDGSNNLNPDWSSTTAPDWKLAQDYDVIFAKDNQMITYRYEQSRIGIVADKNWNFGKYNLVRGDRNYYLKAKSVGDSQHKKPYSVGVEDYYTSKGWTLSVKQDDQFKSDTPSLTSEAQYLDNAVLNFHNGHVEFIKGDAIGENTSVSELVTAFDLQPGGQSVGIMTHKTNKPAQGHYASNGFGIWQYQFGTSKQADYSIGLRVPKTTKRYPTQYKSQLTWSLVIAE